RGEPTAATPLPQPRPAEAGAGEPQSGMDLEEKLPGFGGRPGVAPGIHEIPGGLTPEQNAAHNAAAGPAGLVGPRVGRGSSTTTIPGLGLPPPTFSQRLANNPFWNAGMAMLASRSPYFGQGLGAGMYGATTAGLRSRQEDLLDKKPQMMDVNGKIGWRVGNQIITTEFPSPSAERYAAQERIAEGRTQAARDIARGRREQHESEFVRREAGLDRRAGRERVGEEGRNIRHQENLYRQWYSIFRKDMEPAEAEARARAKVYGTQAGAPAAGPAPPAQTPRPSNEKIIADARSWI